MQELKCEGKGGCGRLRLMAEFISFDGSRAKGYKTCIRCRTHKALERVNAKSQGRNLKQERLEHIAVDAAIKGLEKQATKLVQLEGIDYTRKIFNIILEDM
jgi:hypothetical protein